MKTWDRTWGCGLGFRVLANFDLAELSDGYNL